ncbi:PREDICTED: high choriolytic enzyme 1-like [Priapulus caudatus]|uniref:Metalloendopeptidase n=1 Tax=Priapulus caudatus TaxID=37621 RepID=A0ABM1F3F5_PRICU|nr:PREDICTED: high choriolytic enzyme 1-like [Priapulus caudatus]
MFEGDIDIMNETSRNAIRNDDMKWAGAVVPYVIAGSYDARARQVMQSAFDEYRQKTCVRFVPRTNQRAFINIEPFRGCSSAVGKQGRVQRVSLTRGCVSKGIVAHELMHAIGFWHEQSRADRDSFVRINFENILPNQRYNFQKYTLQAIQHLGEPYDYSSVMHYGPRAFSTGAGPSITPLRSGVTIGQRNGLSRIDVNKINKLYNCNTGGSTPAPTTAPTADCQNENTQCESWAGRGQCQANPRYMLANCRPACGVCGDSTCNDGNRLCPYWASIGECQKNPGYMLPTAQFSAKPVRLWRTAAPMTTATACTGHLRECEAKSRLHADIMQNLLQNCAKSTANLQNISLTN